MNKYGEIPQSQPRGVPLEGAFTKRLITIATEAIPARLPEEKLRWWQSCTDHTKFRVITEAIKDAVYHPPTLRNSLGSWQRFYATLLNRELPPEIGDATHDLDQLAEDYVIVHRSAVTPAAIDRLWNDFPRIFHQGKGENGGFVPMETRPLSEKCRDFYWYLVGIEPLKENTGFERDDENGVLFEELFIQQLFRYWSGKPLTEKWLYAHGSRTAVGGKVPAISWRDQQMNVGYFDREAIKKNLWSTRCFKLK